VDSEYVDDVRVYIPAFFQTFVRVSWACGGAEAYHKGREKLHTPKNGTKTTHKTNAQPPKRRTRPKVPTFDESMHDEETQGSTMDQMEVVEQLSSVQETRQRSQRHATLERGRHTDSTSSDEDTRPNLVPGTDAWKRQRKAKHKEIERRRRDAISKGIDLLKAHLPANGDLETASRGEIVYRAATFLIELKDESRKAVQQLALEKLILQNTYVFFLGKGF
jgi:hypothetical protein